MAKKVRAKNKINGAALFWMNRAVASLIAGALTGLAVFGAALYDELERDYDYEAGERQAFYSWVATWGALPAASTSGIVYLLLPTALRVVGRQRSIATQLEEIIVQRAHQGEPVEQLAQLKTLHEVVEKLDL